MATAYAAYWPPDDQRPSQGSIANDSPSCLGDVSDRLPVTVTVTITDLLAGLRIGPAQRTPPPVGVAQRCCWCERITRHPGDASRPRFVADSICLPCSLGVQFDAAARSYHVILLPERAFADAGMPIRWRVYAELQRAGANVRWQVPSPAAIARALDRDRRTIARAISQLAADGYLLRRPARQRGAVTVYEVRLTMGTRPAPPLPPPGKASPGEP